jgi:16S rRNA (guanine527-N7)-methyltransferase
VSIERALALWGAYAHEHELRWDERTIGCAGAFLERLTAWPQRLVSDRDPERIVADHCIDSLEPLRLGLDFATLDLLDLGSGGGFPGIPLLLCGTPRTLALVDSRARSTGFLQQVIADFRRREATVYAAGQTKAVRGRAEELAQDAGLREKFDVVVTRAVAALPVLLELGSAFLRVGGRLVAYKGPLDAEERQAGQGAACVLGLRREAEIEYTLWGSEKARVLVVYRLERPVPANLPRRTGKPSKRPL